MYSENLLTAFMLTMFAGLATGIGSLLAFFSKQTSKRFLAVALGFSAGVMIYVSMIEIFVKAKDSLVAAVGEVRGYWYTTIAFFCGMFLITLIDKLVPDFENPHEAHEVSELDCCPEKSISSPKSDAGKLHRMGIFSAIAIAIHNFPEGIATFTAALQDPTLGVSIAVAIAIHNIPEGIAVSVPIYYSTGSRRKAFMYSFLSGMSEPVGAIFGYFVLMPFFNDTMFGLLFAGVAGIMVFISLDQLLPAAEKYGEHHLCTYGVVSGMMIMALSLLLFS
ncbi:MAG: zinc transporter ZupT [Candidatus Riflebacteria bacterium]|nr:zinc transporter ZupT [Candidatus Riflebacteria bacterium]